MFNLTKWYLDVVDPTGRAAIAYWSELRWGLVEVRWESLSLYRPGAEPTHRWGIGGATGPLRSSRSDPPRGPSPIRWRSQAFSCDIECRPWTRRFASRLFEADGQSLDWACEAPAATVTLNGPALAGNGYAECLTLSLPPWRLPISELYWGRWACAASGRSIVWIEWRGQQPLTLVLVNGKLAPGARVEHDHIVLGDLELSLGDARTLYSRTLGDMLGGLGPVAARLPASWRALEDCKTMSTGTLRERAGAGPRAASIPDTGWAIHERVRFP